MFPLMSNGLCRTGYNDVSIWSKQQNLNPGCKVCIKKKEIKGWGTYLRGNSTRQMNQEECKLSVPQPVGKGERRRVSITSGYREKEVISDKLIDLNGNCPQYTLPLFEKRKLKTALSLFGIKIVEQAYLSRNISNSLKEFSFRLEFGQQQFVLSYLKILVKISQPSTK